ncbi:energy-coupling factor transporter transmembrane component T [Pseudarthrobacter sp. AL07]|uniref:energy-coupling factor transporter transmembrane component T n=1 Tax=unclassified Pseudarthrobacter TaxID=2647000 RepID=UPI00249B68B1|nr:MULTISPECIES: energy-coupling factor transporter transmembrane component T [unclassified Pseudarthrobacter]MDI3194647.1 energy-coupling factor transporter transmembrane component T [Pseudarthrobacter sp. AL20]MDI3208714.1 energy-coupling factor transporter transmembrane component T [Pseudarthrobacter sp. AL07]
MRLHPLTSLAAAGSTAVITTAAASWPVSLTVIAAAVGLSFAQGAARRMLPAAAVILVPLVLSLLALHGLFFPEGTTVLAQWGPARVTAQGLQFALERAAQLSAAVLVLLLGSFTVSVPDLVAVLSTRGVNARFAFVLASTLTLLPAISSRLERIRQAQEARGLVIRPGIPGRVAAFRWQAVPLLLSLVEEAGTRAAALQARGFGSAGPITSYRQVLDSPVQRWARVVLLLAALAAIVFRLWQPTAGA